MRFLGVAAEVGRTLVAAGALLCLVVFWREDWQAPPPPERDPGPGRPEDLFTEQWVSSLNVPARTTHRRYPRPS